MRNKNKQMSLFDIYNDVSKSVENKKPKVSSLLKKHIDFENIIPESFYRIFYLHYDQNNIYHLESYIRVLLMQKILSIPIDKLLLDKLKFASELTDLCSFDTIHRTARF